MKNYRKIKKKKMLYITKLGFGSWLCVGKVLTPYNARSKMVSLIK